MRNIKQAKSIDDLLLNDAFVELVKCGNQEGLFDLKLQCRQQALLIDEVILLINNVCVNLSLKTS